MPQTSLNDCSSAHSKQKAEQKAKVAAPPSELDVHKSTRPIKRRRIEPHGAETPKSVRSEPRSAAPSRPTQIISSLFSFNPEITVPESEIQNISKKPSNAPLKDKFTFDELGLDPLLIAHLRKKMSINTPTSIQRASLENMLGKSNTPQDLFIQAQTGSGKTLAYLLPIVHSLLPLSGLSYIDRSVGTLAIIIAPTRELATQISDVLEALLQLRLRPETASLRVEDREGLGRFTRWLVSGVLTGGSTRTHEKARLRKGIPILVGTPGRLLDHLQNTESFNFGKCQWLVLDEADRLMELGFEETIKGIIHALDERRRLAAVGAVKGITTTDVGGWNWNTRRRTVLCSATIRDHVQQLAGHALSNPIMIKGDELQVVSTDAVVHPSAVSKGGKTGPSDPVTKFTPPSQLAQKYVTVPLKLRLVSLIALIRSIISDASTSSRNNGGGTRIIIFLSCTDSVDFHWQLLEGVTMGGQRASSSSGLDSDVDVVVDSGDDTSVKRHKPFKSAESMPIAVKSALLPNTSIFRLHGSLPLSTRLATMKAFSARSGNSIHKRQDGTSTKSESAVLFCTSVASRGLDLPLVRAVIQYDLPTENGSDEYVHRVGRTARAGKGGEAWSFIIPSETEWVPWIEKSISEDNTQGVRLEPIAVQELLKRGFGGKGSEYEARATQLQLAFERWVLGSNEVCLSPNRSYRMRY